jgi:hypothetical protein
LDLTIPVRKRWNTRKNVKRRIRKGLPYPRYFKSTGKE